MQSITRCFWPRTLSQLTNHMTTVGTEVFVHFDLSGLELCLSGQIIIMTTMNSPIKARTSSFDLMFLVLNFASMDKSCDHYKRMEPCAQLVSGFRAPLDPPCFVIMTGLPRVG